MLNEKERFARINFIMTFVDDAVRESHYQKIVEMPDAMLTKEYEKVLSLFNKKLAQYVSIGNPSTADLSIIRFLHAYLELHLAYSGTVSKYKRKKKCQS